MRAIWKWILLFVGVLVLAFLVALPFFVGRSLGLARMPMMFMFGGGPGFMPAFGGFGLLGGLFLFGRFIFPLLLIVLAVFGLVSLLRGGQSSRPQPAAPMAAASATAPAASTDVMQASSAPVEQAAPAATIPCAHCGSPLQTGWVACPYCGEKV
ncbi:MAG: zinc ribbon domain-containing protein [Negativicutes bacterium]|nr:zinc ribbon domain-containing protein [Negativicutes bacterium]MDR3588938.1 zinc ribbon domain-containing protein [Negativicutes bacterium]